MERIHAPHKIELGTSPNNSDLAITSIDNKGTPGRLNLYVLKEYEYPVSFLPKKEHLGHGFSQVWDNNRKPILFVVTVGEGLTGASLENNLYKVLAEFPGWYRDKSIWVPLMGTGDGGLFLEESYLITVNTINRYLSERPINVTFNISLPNDEKGRELLNKINEFNSTDADKAIAEFKGNYYLVGATWENENQLDSFFDKNIWQTGYEDKYAKIINKINEGDVLFVKSTFGKTGSSILRIKAVGKVTKNLGDGHTLEVIWKLKDIEFDIVDFGFYRNTIYKIEAKTLNRIFDTIGIKLLFSSGIFDVQEWGRSNANVKLDNDSAYTPTDLLDISSEINVFARLLTQKDLNPPLALALFGDWGSGKSFFINHLQTKIKDLSNSKIFKKDSNDLYYCKNIIHIPFNAWAYLDANLWIGFMACIFEKIDEYITGQTKLGKLKAGVKAKLSNELQFIKNQKANAIDKKIKLQEKRKELEDCITEEKEKIQKTIKDLTEESWIERIKAVWEELEVEEISKTKLKELGLTPEILEKTANSEIPSRIHTVSNYWRQLKQLSGKQLLGTFLFALGLIIAGEIVYDTEWFVHLVNRTTEITVALVFGLLGLITKFTSAFYYFKPYIDKALKIQLDFNQKIKEAEREHQEKITQKQLEKDNASNELKYLESELQKINGEIEDIEYALKNGIEKIVLNDFIKNRINSSDYTEKLGIVSVIRKDLETLSELFLGQEIDSRLPENEKKQLEEKKVKLEEIKEAFDGEPIERIILYIDDLDRCSDDKVLEVLQAVHLLMAFPLFIVVVGVDKRCVSNALFQSEQSKYFKLHAESQIQNHNIQPIDPDEYLEKIFQIPFQLKDSSPVAVNKMIESLLKNDISINDNITPEEKPIDKNLDPKESKDSLTKKPSGSSNILPSNVIGPEDLKITKEELDYIKDISHLIGPSPRTIKRFINLYRLIKAHEGLGKTNSEIETISALFILAINIGKFKKLSSTFFDNLLLNPKKKVKEIYKIYDADESMVFHNALNVKNNSMGKLSDYQCQDVLKHYSFVKRFSFNTHK